MNGTGWTTLLSTANGSTGSVNLADQNNTNAGRVLASALVYARTGNARTATRWSASSSRSTPAR